jgi:hypothetical protein
MAPQTVAYSEQTEPSALVVADTAGVPGIFAHLTEKHFANDAAFLEAWEQYGDDADRELADLEAGRHPLQRAHG